MSAARGGVAQLVIDVAFDVHRTLGPGLLESTYERCLAYELRARDIHFALHVPIALSYKGVSLDCGYRADVIVEDTVLLALKAVDALQPIHFAQMATYLKLSGLSQGLLINFNERRLEDGLKTILN